MSVIYPFRYIRTSVEQPKCEICGEPTPRVDAYSVVSDGNVEGYVCAECFMILNAPLHKAN